MYINCNWFYSPFVLQWNESVIPSIEYFSHESVIFTAKMTAQVVMTHDYPKVAPIFVVSVLWQHERTALNDKHVKVRTQEFYVHVRL